MRHVDRIKTLFILLVIGLVGLVITSAVKASLPIDRDGWTIIEPSADTVQIYVSASAGDDNNDGLSPESPVKSLSRALSIVRDGDPDHVLLKRGDVWIDSFGALSRGSDGALSGRSADEPMVFGAYGNVADPRPLLKIGSNDGIAPWSSRSVGDSSSFIAIVGLHFYAHTRDPNSPDFKGKSGGDGVKVISAGEDLLIEDCLFEYCDVSVAPYESDDPDARFANFTMRRCGIFGNYSSGGHAQGLFITETDGILLEECTFAGNGWNAQTGAERTKFNHNAYVTTYCSGLIARGNIFLRGSASGLQARCGGEVTDNVFVENAEQLNWGYYEGPADATPGGVTGSVKRNVFVDAVPRDDEPSSFWSMCIGNVRSGEIRRNFVWRSGGMHFTATKENERVGVNDLLVTGNAIYSDRREGFRLFQVLFDGLKIKGNIVISPIGPVKDRDGAMDVTRRVIYSANVERDELPGDGTWEPLTVARIASWAGGDESVDGFERLVLEQRRGHWNPLLTGGNVSALIRHHASLATGLDD